MEFTNIDKSEVHTFLKNGTAVLEDIPTAYFRTKLSEDSTGAKCIRLQTGKYAPYLICHQCTSVFVWYSFSTKTEKWTNAGGYSEIRKHLKSRCVSSKQLVQGKVLKQGNVKNFFESCKPGKLLTPSLREQWKTKVASLAADHPTVSINACVTIAYEAALFASSLTHREKTLFDFSMGRTCATQHILHLGKCAASQMRHLFNVCCSNPRLGISGCLDYWSARKGYLAPYGGIIACGLDMDWSWFQFPVKIEELQNESHDAEFTYNMLMQSLSVDGQPSTFTDPFFITTDNERKMSAAFDGRFETDGFHFGGRIACAEHLLSTCVTRAMSDANNVNLAETEKMLNSIESYYNVHTSVGKELPLSHPAKCATRPWRSHYRRYEVCERNYRQYQIEPSEEVTNNLPSLLIIKSLKSVLHCTKDFFDEIEVSGPTQHLLLISYLRLDIRLFLAEKGNNEYSTNASRMLAKDIRTLIGDKLWPACGSPMAKTAAYLTGIDVKRLSAVVSENIAGVSDGETFIAAWEAELNDFNQEVEHFLRRLLEDVDCNKTEVSFSVKGDDRIPSCNDEIFNKIFDDKASTSHVPGTSTNSKSDNQNTIQKELILYEKLKIPMKDPTSFWRKETAATIPLLRQAAKRILSIPGTSAMIERLFSETGIILSPRRRRMSSELLEALVYLKYKQRVQKLMRKLDVLDKVPMDNLVLEQEVQRVIDFEDNCDNSSV